MAKGKTEDEALKYKIRAKIRAVRLDTTFVFTKNISFLSYYTTSFIKKASKKTSASNRSFQFYEDHFFTTFQFIKSFF